MQVMSKTKVNQKKEKSHLSIFVYVYIFKFYNVYFVTSVSKCTYILIQLPFFEKLYCDAFIIMYNDL